MKHKVHLHAHVGDKLTVTVLTRTVGRPWLWLGVAFIRIGVWFLGRFGVDARIDTGPWERVWPRKREQARDRPGIIHHKEPVPTRTPKVP